jgi:large subunit ribosomal protein L28
MKSIYVPELGKNIKIKVSVSALKTIDKIGLMRYLKKQDLQLSDIV